MQQLPINLQWWSTLIIQQSHLKQQCSVRGGIILPQGSHQVNLQTCGTCRESSYICLRLLLLEDISINSTSSSFQRMTNQLGACSAVICMCLIMALLKHLSRYSFRLIPEKVSILSIYFGWSNQDFSLSKSYCVTSPGCVTKV